MRVKKDAHHISWTITHMFRWSLLDLLTNNNNSQMKKSIVSIVAIKCINLSSTWYTWTSLMGGLISLSWHLPFLSPNKRTDAHQHIQELPCPHDKGGDQLVVFTLCSPLKDTKLYLLTPALCVTAVLLFNMPLTCWCSLKGTRMRTRCSVCLTLSQWLQTPSIHHCLPGATSFFLPFQDWIGGPPGCTYI